MLSAIAVKAALYGRANACSLELLLCGDGDDRPIQRVRQSVQEANDNSWVVFRFPPVADSAGRDYRFVLSSPDAAPGNACGLYHSRESTYREGKMQTNGRAGKGALVFQAFVERGDPEETRRLIKPERANNISGGQDNDGANTVTRSLAAANIAPQLREELQSLKK